MNKNNSTNFAQQRLLERGIDEFIGICKGIIFDGIVCQSEAVNLLAWLDNNKAIAYQWPANDVYQKLSLMLGSGNLSADDEATLLDMLVKITGSPAVMLDGDNPSSLLPLCDPAPAICFADRLFILTGNFKIGPRKLLAQEIEARGGKVLSDMRLDTDYLVIGDIGSKAWMHSTHGRKIEKAIELREKGSGIAIISEQHLMDSINK